MAFLGISLVGCGAEPPTAPTSAPTAAEPAPVAASCECAIGNPMTRVVVASRTIEPGTAISADDLIEREAPHSYYPESIFTGRSLVVGHSTSSRIYAGEAIRPERLVAGQIAPTATDGPAVAWAWACDCSDAMGIAFVADFPAGHVLTEADLVGVTVPAMLLPPDAARSPEGVVGATLAEPVYANEWALHARQKP